jgi:hypothetical protein
MRRAGVLVIGLTIVSALTARTAHANDGRPSLGALLTSVLARNQVTADFRDRGPRSVGLCSE